LRFGDHCGSIGQTSLELGHLDVLAVLQREFDRAFEREGYGIAGASRRRLRWRRLLRANFNTEGREQDGDRQATAEFSNDRPMMTAGFLHAHLAIVHRILIYSYRNDSTGCMRAA